MAIPLVVTHVEGLMQELPLPASLTQLHKKTDMEGLIALLPLLLEKPQGFTADILHQVALERGIFPDMDDTQVFWKVRRSLRNYQKIGYVTRTHTAWYVPASELIKAECEDAAHEASKVMIQYRDLGRNLLQVALTGPDGVLQAAPPAQVSAHQPSAGLRGLAAARKERKSKL